MSSLDLARWQFGITTVYHFLFVPLTIGLAPLVAIMQTAWHAHRQRALPAADQVLRQALPDQLRDGRGHRHRAGVPVRHELERATPASSATSSAPRWPSRRCSAFFLESTFLGLWIFGWDRLPKRVHLARSGSPRSARTSRRTSSSPRTPSCSTRSASAFNPESGRAELNDFGAVLTNITALVDVPAHHRRRASDRRRASCSASALWHLAPRGRATPRRRDVPRRALRLGARRRPGRRRRRASSPATCRARS